MCDLDCSSPETTRSSVARLLNMPVGQVSELLESLIIPFSEDPRSLIMSHGAPQACISA